MSQQQDDIHYAPALAERLREFVPHHIALEFECAPLSFVRPDLTVALSPNAPLTRRDDITHALVSHTKGLASENILFTEEPYERIRQRQHILYPPIVATEQSQIQRLWQEILDTAVARGASDITVEPYEGAGRVRFTVHGACHTVDRFQIDESTLRTLASYLRTHGQVRPDTINVPGDGTLRAESRGHTIEMRIATMPLVDGPRTCLRLQTASPKLLDLTQLGMTQELLHIFERETARPDFSIVIAGPMGSGKTTTARAVLLQLPIDMNIASLENPVEMRIAQIAQVEIPLGQDDANSDKQVTFNSAFRSCLRQPINAVFVGEIRDDDTMRLMLLAATSGISLIATAHTRNAPAIMNRFLRLGASPHDIPEALTMAMSQRLLRMLCTHCRLPVEPSENIKRLAHKYAIDLPEHVYAANEHGCSQCDHGISDRIGAFELLPITPDVADEITRGASALRIAQVAERHGYRPMIANAISHLAAGKVDETTIRRTLYVDAFEAA